MKVSIRDGEALAAVKPLELIAYLRSSGWNKTIETPGKWSTWVRKSESGEEFEIAAPLIPTFRDFALRMSDALKVLEVVEHRSQLEILRDLFVTSADVVRLRLADHELADGTVPIEDGTHFFQGARDLLLAAACAAAGPKAYYPSKRPSQATDYLRRARLGQTEHGSFVVTIVSKVPPSLGQQNGHLFDTEEPFERRVTQQLALSVQALRDAAEQAATSGQVKSFIDAVPKGVSANLCDAIVSMGRCAEGNRNLELSFSWSRNRPVVADVLVPSSIYLASDILPVVEEASRYLKEYLPREDFEVVGPVVRLDRAEGDSTGKVTVHCFVDGQPRKVQVELGDKEYHQALEAHDKKHVIRCEGLLIREGRAFRLGDPHSFGVVDDV